MYLYLKNAYIAHNTIVLVAVVAVSASNLAIEKCAALWYSP